MFGAIAGGIASALAGGAMSKLFGGGQNFFFQAEDGIRDTSVTGVQTCALPIFTAPASRHDSRISGVKCKPAVGAAKIGRASCRERVVWWYCWGYCLYN